MDQVPDEANAVLPADHGGILAMPAVILAQSISAVNAYLRDVRRPCAGRAICRYEWEKGRERERETCWQCRCSTCEGRPVAQAGFVHLTDGEVRRGW